MSDRTSAQVVASNVTGTSLVKSGSGRACMLGVSTLVAAAITLHDCATTGEAAIGNQIACLPASAVGHYLIDMPFYKGLVAVAGAGIIIIGYQ